MNQFYLETTKSIEGEEPLVELLNYALKRMNLAKMTSAPTGFEEFSNLALQECPRNYCQCLLCEKWMHEVVERLRMWKEKAGVYLGEFNGEWKYFACSNRLDAIKDGWGDEDDFDEAGNVITEGLTDEQLSGYTIIDVLYLYCRDLVQDTKPEDLQVLWTILQLDATVTISDFFRHIGSEIPVYRMGDDGELVRMTREDEDLMKVSSSVSADDTMGLIYRLALSVNAICGELEKADRFDDNRELIERVMNKSDDILNLRFDNG